MSSNVWFCSLKSRNTGTGKRVIEPGAEKEIEGVANRSAFLYGKGFNRTPSTTLPITVAAAMPNDKVRMATIVTPGFFPSMRRP